MLDLPSVLLLLWTFHIDETWCFPVRSNPENTSKLLLLIRYHGAHPSWRPWTWEPTVRCPHPCNHCSMSCFTSSNVYTNIPLGLGWMRIQVVCHGWLHRAYPAIQCWVLRSKDCTILGLHCQRPWWEALEVNLSHAFLLFHPNRKGGGYA